MVTTLFSFLAISAANTNMWLDNASSATVNIFVLSPYCIQTWTWTYLYPNADANLRLRHGPFDILGGGGWDLCLGQKIFFGQYRSKVILYLCQSETGVAILVFNPSKNTNMVDDDKILLPVKFLWIPLTDFRGEAELVSANQRPGGNLGFPTGQKKKHKLSREP